MSESSVRVNAPRRRYQEELVPSKRSKGKDNSGTESPHSIRHGRGKREQIPPAQPPAIPKGETAPIDATPPTSSAPTDSQSLAERYVAQYETQSGHTLSADERSAKVKEVEQFYTEASRDGRLAKIVFA